MLNYILTILSSFFVTFAITVPFINFLYKFNIRRISKLDLDKLLPGRQVKMGTPIMGGTVIISAIAFLSIILLRDWEYLTPVLLILFAGGIFGAIDEYTNTLGRTIMAVRISKSANGIVESLFPVDGIMLKIKKIAMTPWKLFEESLRIMGGEQKGLKNHYKFLMYLSVVIAPLVFMILNNHETTLYILKFVSLDLGYFYYILLAF
ncbi:hypothetical protein CO178_01700, partial [candidate division WWE3 bacterium CG_4_9_14_3_um_filter_34_6]